MEGSIKLKNAKEISSKMRKFNFPDEKASVVFHYQHTPLMFFNCHHNSVYKYIAGMPVVRLGSAHTASEFIDVVSQYLNGFHEK